MGKRRRAIATCLVVALLGLGAACSSDGSSKAQARSAAQAKAKAAKRTRTLALQRRRQAARRIAAQRRAAAARRLRAQAAAAPRITVPVTIPAIAPATPAADLAAIERTFTGLNAAFGKGVAAGIVSSISANYWVAAGQYSAAQCTKFEAGRGEGVVSEAFVVHPETLRPDPGWVDPTVGKAPTGRIYTISVDNIQTLVPTGEKRQQSAVMHATVNSAGTARLFFRCA